MSSEQFNLYSHYICKSNLFMSLAAITTSSIRPTVNHLLRSAIGTARSLHTQHHMYTCRPVNPYTSGSSPREQALVKFDYITSSSDLGEIHHGIKQQLSAPHSSDASQRATRLVITTLLTDEKGIRISEVPKDFIGHNTALKAKIFATQASNHDIKNFVNLRYCSMEQPGSDDKQYSYYFFEQKDGSLTMRKGCLVQVLLDHNTQNEHKMLNDDYAQN